MKDKSKYLCRHTPHHVLIFEKPLREDDCRSICPLCGSIRDLTLLQLPDLSLGALYFSSGLFQNYNVIKCMNYVEKFQVWSEQFCEKKEHNYLFLSRFLNFTATAIVISITITHTTTPPTISNSFLFSKKRKSIFALK